MSAAASKHVELIILQGAPGSGKSTYAASLSGVEVCSTDEFFVGADGVYTFNAAKLCEAHVWNQARVYEALMSGKSVVVDNTNILRWYAIPYVRMGMELNAQIRFHRCVGEFENTHGVKPGVDANDKGTVKWQRKQMETLSISSVLAARVPDFVIAAVEAGPTVADLLQAKQEMLKARYPLAENEIPKTVWPDHSILFRENGFLYHIAGGKRYVCYLPNQGLQPHTHDVKEEFIVSTGEATVGCAISAAEQEKTFVYGPGTTISVATGIVHWLKASSSGCCFQEDKDMSKIRKTSFI